MTTARELERHATVYCPMFQNDVIIETCEGDKTRLEKPCRYFQGYGLWYVPGYHGRDVKYGVGCNFTHEDWEAP